MINCGAICNVVDLLSHLSPEAYVYIVDSNRPVHLANVYPKKDRCSYHPLSAMNSGYRPIHWGCPDNY